MMKKLSLVVSLLLIAITVLEQGVNAVTTKHSTDIHNDLDPVTDIRITEPDSNGKRRVLIRSRDLIAENSHELHLEEIAPVFAEDAVVEFSSGETKSAMSWASTSYLMKPSKSAGTTEWAMMRINKEGVLQGVFTIENGARLLQLDHVENFKDRMDENAHSRLLSEAVHSYVIHDTHETTLNPKYRNLLRNGNGVVGGCAVEQSRNTTEMLKKRYANMPKRGRKTEEVIGEPQSIKTLPSGYIQFWGDSSDPCYNLDVIAREFLIGIAADFGFYKATGATVAKAMAEIESTVSSSRLVYMIQLNVLLKVGKVVLTDVVTSSTPAPLRYDPAAGNCEMLTSGFLNTLKTWNRDVNEAVVGNKMGHWHHLTNCWPPPGVVGVAEVAALCDSIRNVGITSRISTTTTWQIFAHELGHGFGMSHSFENGQGTTGGIMDYGNPFYNGVIQFHPLKKPEACQEISYNINCKFLTQSTVTSTGCGNGLLEAGETCECMDLSKACTGCSNCQLVNPNQQCSTSTFVMRTTPADKTASFVSVATSSLSDPVCCSSNLLMESNTRCGADGNDVCNFGKCIRTCSRFGLVTCASTFDNCRTPCRYAESTTCSDQFRLSSTNELVSYMAVGSPCKNGAGTCSSTGTCVANSPTTSPPPTTKSPVTSSPTTKAPTTKAPVTSAPTTKAPASLPTTLNPTTKAPVTSAPTTKAPASLPTTLNPTTKAPVTSAPTTITVSLAPTSQAPSSEGGDFTPTASPEEELTPEPTLSPELEPTTMEPTFGDGDMYEYAQPTKSPTRPTRRTRRPKQTRSPFTRAPTVPTSSPTPKPTNSPTTKRPTNSPTTKTPTTSRPTKSPTTKKPTSSPVTRSPTEPTIPTLAPRRKRSRKGF